MEVGKYLESLHKSWIEKPEDVFGKLPFFPKKENGFSTLCAPIPWMGDVESASFAIISLEPLIDGNNFCQQVTTSQTFDGWRNFYFEKYFENFFELREGNGTRYWNTIKTLAKGLQKTNYTGPKDFSILTDSVVVFPLCQYHAKKHPSYKFSPKVEEDLNIRISFFANQRKSKGWKPKCICLGKKISELILGKFDKYINEELDKNIISSEDFDKKIKSETINLLKNKGSDFKEKTDPIHIVEINIKDIPCLFFVRKAPFSNGHQLIERNTIEIGRLIREY